MTSATIALVRESIEDEFGFSPGIDNTWEGLGLVAREHEYHPVCSYLDALSWDGGLRIERLAGEVLNVPAASLTPVVQKMIRCWFVSAVARVRNPGCKVDTSLVLVGPQGALKSTFFRVLGKPWFVDTSIDLSNKDAYLQLSKAWIYEWPEIEGVTSSKAPAILKAFLTSQSDTFRPPYARGVVDLPRSCVIVGTTNEAHFLNDATGSRRFWVVNVGGRVNVEIAEEWRDQLWAEASVAYASGERWYLDAVDDTSREDLADDHYIGDTWEEPIARWLERPRERITTTDLLAQALNIPLVAHRKGDQLRVGSIMRRLGYCNARERAVVSGDGKEKNLRVWRKSGLILH